MSKTTANRNVLNILIKRLLITILILTPLLLFLGVSYLDLRNDPDEHRPWVSWYDDPQKRIYIGFETLQEESAVIYYTLKNSDGYEQTFSVNEQEVTKFHHIELSGLESDSYYNYSVYIDGKYYGGGNFRTAPNTTGNYEEFKWVMFSDTQQPKLTPGHHQRIARAIRGENYSFAAIVGDLVDEGRRKSDWNNFFSVVNQYSDTIPLIPVVGNHDRLNGGGYFPIYFNNSEIADNHLFLYSFNYSSVHFTMLSIEYGRMSEITDEQLNWLEADLQDSKDMPFKIVMFHCPITGAGLFGRNENLINNVLPVLQKYNVTATIHGHEHHFEHGTIPNSINPGMDMKYFILGGGGGAFDPGLKPQPETEYMTATPCYTEVSANAECLIFRTLTVTGELMDTVRIDRSD